MAKPILILPYFEEESFTCLTTIPTERGLSSAAARRRAYGFFRLGIFEVILAIWAINVLLIAAAASFGGQPFLDAFDVSVAPF